MNFQLTSSFFWFINISKQTLCETFSRSEICIQSIKIRYIFLGLVDENI